MVHWMSDFGKNALFCVSVVIFKRETSPVAAVAFNWSINKVEWHTSQEWTSQWICIYVPMAAGLLIN